MKYNEKLVDLMAQYWNKRRKDELQLLQCPTVFKVSGFRCMGVYGHKGFCQDVNYPMSSKDLELVP